MYSTMHTIEYTIQTYSTNNVQCISDQCNKCTPVCSNVHVTLHINLSFNVYCIPVYRIPPLYPCNINVYHMDINISTVPPIQCIHDLDTMYRFHGTSWTWKAPISHRKAALFNVQDASSSASSGLSSSKKPQDQGPMLDVEPRDLANIQEWLLSTRQNFSGFFNPFVTRVCLLGADLHMWYLPIIAQVNGSIGIPQDSLFLVIHKNPGFHFGWSAYAKKIQKDPKRWLGTGNDIRIYVFCPKKHTGSEGQVIRSSDSLESTLDTSFGLISLWTRDSAVWYAVEKV